jgi:SurA N-terminal domain
MNCRFSKFVVLAAVLLFNFGARAGQIIDAIVATVNGHVILRSDWEDALRCEAFLNMRPLDALTAEVRKSALDRLIDQELLREQLSASASSHLSPEEVAAGIAKIRKQYPGTETEEGWRHVLARYALTEKALESYLEMQMNLMRQVDTRFRPSVDVDARSVESYYNQELLPQLRQAGTSDVPLAEVTSTIKEVLTQRRMNEMLISWLQNLRAASEIHSDTPFLQPAEQRR